MPGQVSVRCQDIYRNCTNSGQCALKSQVGYPTQVLGHEVRTNTRLPYQDAYLRGRLRKRVTFRQLDVPLAARNRALDYLANNRRALSDELRYQLTQVVEGYIGRCDEDAARAGIEWMRQQYRTTGKT